MIIFKNHIWCGFRAAILGNSEIGEGSVVGAYSLVKGKYDNSSIIAGIPAKTIRNEIIWDGNNLLTKIM